MLRPDDLVSLPDFQIGSIMVSPSRRVAVRGDQTLAVEPRVMQVLVLLARHRGQVIKRKTLFDEVWGGVPVGDDSLNRAIAGVRKVLELDSLNLKLETIPRTGYRLQAPLEGDADQPGLTRRKMIVFSAAAAVGASGLGTWAWKSRSAEEFDQLMKKGEDAIAYGDPAANPAQFFERAVEIRPDDSRAMGLLAYSSALRIGIVQRPADLALAATALQKAVTIDPREPHARIAEIMLQRSTLDFISTEDRLQEILAEFPNNVPAMRLLWNLRHCVGRSRDALNLVEQALRIQPFAAYNHFPRAQLFWILGRNAEADRVIDEALGFWPDHQFVRFARFIIFAFTHRERAALEMISSPRTAPQLYSSEEISLWRISLKALEQRSPTSIAAAREAYLEAASRKLTLASQGILVLSALGETDAAFKLANALFAVPRGTTADVGPSRSTAWRFAPWLFTPPTAAIRQDARFTKLCDAIGLTNYWSMRKIQPDYLRTA